MFRKLVSSLPYSPALAGQLAFYARRLRREEATRKLGLVFVILAILVQSLAVFSPPEPTLARTNTPSQEPSQTTPNIERSKQVRNLTQIAEGLPGTPVRAEDRLEYTLLTTNKGVETTTVSIQESFGDVLEYGELVENGGGTFDALTKTLHWENITLAPNQTDTRRLVVRIFNNIPSTPQVADSASYDCILSNTYGNTVELAVACPTTKLIENTVQQLPATGSAENIFFGGALIATATYFYIRNRQLTKEVRLLRKEFNGGTI